MTQSTYNLNHLVSIIINDKRPAYYFKYKPFKKSFWGNTQEGFYDEIYRRYTKQQLIEGGTGGWYAGIKFIVDDNNKVFMRPYVTLIFSNDDRIHKEFDTIEECLKFTEEFSVNLPNKYILKS